MKKRIYVLSIFVFSMLAVAAYFTNTNMRSEQLRLIELLHEKQFEELHDIFSEKVADVERDISREIALEVSILALANDDPAHEALLSEWVSLFSDSAIPYMVRGAYFRSLGATWRGQAYARKTSDENQGVRDVDF